jgi:molybdopterin/thiamine biosynthesis adenylyltransferase
MRRSPQAERHNRQIRMPAVGVDGQARLEGASVLIVGCGGLGSPVIQYLAAAGLGHICLMDDDRVELSNLNRQIVHREQDIGRLKTERAHEWITEIDSGIQVIESAKRLTVTNGRESVRGFDLVLDCTDGFASKFLLNDVCVLERVALIHGAVAGFGGQMMVLSPGGQPCLRCLFETIPEQMPGESCQEVGVLGASCGVIGTQMAAQALVYLLQKTSVTVGQFLTFELDVGTQRRFAVSPRGDCEVCGEEPLIDGADPSDYRNGVGS